METGAFERTELPSGLRILTERMPSVRSVALGIWTGVGSRDETPRQSGASHFLEHLLFRGTERRTAIQIDEEIDEVGGELNAFTSKEYTCFYARTLDRDLPLAVDLLLDVVLHAKLARSDVEAERSVILDEIGMHNDTPDDLVHEVHSQVLFGGHQLGRPVLGTTESIKGMSRDAIRRHWRRWYTPENLVVAAAGSCSHDEIVAQVNQVLRQTRFAEQPGRRQPRRAPLLHGGVAVRHRPIDQAYVVYGMQGLSRSDPRRFALGVLNFAFGGGASSRLFQQVRNNRGLAYHIYSYLTHYSETGSFSVYAGTSASNVHELLAVVRDEVDRLMADGLTEEELARGKGHLKGSMVLGMEDPAGRMTRLGKSELTSGEILSVDEVLRRVDEVSDADIRAVAKEILSPSSRALAVIGPFDDKDDFERYVR